MGTLAEMKRSKPLSASLTCPAVTNYIRTSSKKYEQRPVGWKDLNVHMRTHQTAPTNMQILHINYSSPYKTHPSGHNKSFPVWPHTRLLTCLMSAALNKYNPQSRLTFCGALLVAVGCCVSARWTGNILAGFNKLGLEGSLQKDCKYQHKRKQRFQNGGMKKNLHLHVLRAELCVPV